MGVSTWWVKRGPRQRREKNNTRVPSFGMQPLSELHADPDRKF